MLYYCYFVLLGCFWGGSFIGIKYAVAAIPPVAAALARVLVGMTFLALLFRWQGKSLTIPKRLLWKVWLAGLFGIGIPFSFLFWGERLVNPGLAGIINGTVPIWTFFLGLIFLRRLETVTVRKVVGLILGLCGAIVIFYPQLRPAADQNEVKGILAIFVMALCYSVAMLLNRRFLTQERQIPLTANVFHQNLVSVFYLLLVSLAGEDWRQLNGLWQSPAAWISILYLGIVSTALALLMHFTLIREWGAYRASTSIYITIISSLVLDYLFFHNLPDHYQILGVITILGGISLLQWPERQAAPPPLVKNDRSPRSIPLGAKALDPSNCADGAN